MQGIGQEGDDRKFRRLRKTDYYEAKKAVEAKQVTRFPRCQICGRLLDSSRKDYGDICFQCFNEPL